jgi:1-acyl-sn-glycerol-3-phosphate acyltransferase
MYDPDYIREQTPRIMAVLKRYFRAEISGMENLPTTPFIAAGNHSAGILIPDTLLWMGFYHLRAQNPPMLALAHNAIFDHYPQALSTAFSRLGAIRADFKLAETALQQGYAVSVYPGGDFDACRSIFQRNKVIFAGRTGYIKLAQQAGVPIVPVASQGAHKALAILWDGAPLAKWLGLDHALRLKTFPLSLLLPYGLWLGPMPPYLPLPVKIRLQVLPPIWPEGSVEAVDQSVQAALQSALEQA